MGLVSSSQNWKGLYLFSFQVNVGIKVMSFLSLSVLQNLCHYTILIMNLQHFQKFSVVYERGTRSFDVCSFKINRKNSGFFCFREGSYFCNRIELSAV